MEIYTDKMPKSCGECVLIHENRTMGCHCGITKRFTTSNSTTDVCNLKSINEFYKEIYNKLAEYENTGLEPHEIESLKTELSDAQEIVCTAAGRALRNGIIKQSLRAENEVKDKRIAVLEKALELACEKLAFCPNPSDIVYDPDSEREVVEDNCDHYYECDYCRKQHLITQAEKELPNDK